MIRVVRLRVLDNSFIELRDDVPRTVADCPSTRPCPHIRCPFHLWLDAHEPHAASPTGKPTRPTRLLPRWLEDPLPASCALDVARAARPRGGMSFPAIARAMGLSVRTVEKLAERAIRRVRAEAGAR